VLLDVEEAGRVGSLDRVGGVDQRAPAEEQRRRRVGVRVDSGQDLERTAGRLGVERGQVLREAGPDEPREAFADRRRLGVIPDQNRRQGILRIVL